jgi:hypothetical protein
MCLRDEASRDMPIRRSASNVVSNALMSRTAYSTRHSGARSEITRCGRSRVSKQLANEDSHEVRTPNPSLLKLSDTHAAIPYCH